MRTENPRLKIENDDVQMSHHISDELFTFPFHTMELTNPTRQAKAVQIIKAHVPEFHAWMCQARGMRLRRKPVRAKIGKRG